jgi:hypothetical protein
LVNIILLVTGYGLGQGCLLLSQSYLVLHGQSAFIGQFGLIYTLNTLLYFIVDWGSPVALTRATLKSRLERPQALSAVFWSFSLCRFLVAVAASVVTVTAAAFAGHPFSLGFAVLTAPGLLMWAFNSIGVLDGFEHSGASGLSVSLPVVMVAAALPFASLYPPLFAGELLGGAYSAGIVASVIIQYQLAKRFGAGLRLARPSRNHMVQLGHEGALYLMSTLPGQFFYRGQLSIISTAVTLSTLGHIVLAKQIVNAALQFLYFVRRAEFPRLLTRIAHGEAPIRAIWLSQRFTLLASVLGTFGLAVLGTVGSAVVPPQLVAPAHAVAILSPVVIASGLYSIMNQGFAACAKLGVAAFCACAMLLVGLALCFLLRHQGVVGMSIAEASANFSIAALMLYGFWSGLIRPAAPRASPSPKSAELLGTKI